MYGLNITDIDDLLVRFDDFFDDLVDRKFLSSADVVRADGMTRDLVVDQLPEVTFNLRTKSLHKLVPE